MNDITLFIYFSFFYNYSSSIIIHILKPRRMFTLKIVQRHIYRVLQLRSTASEVGSTRFFPFQKFGEFYFLITCITVSTQFLDTKIFKYSIKQ